VTYRPHPVPACLRKTSSWRAHTCGGDPMRWTGPGQCHHDPPEARPVIFVGTSLLRHLVHLSGPAAPAAPVVRMSGRQRAFLQRTTDRTHGSDLVTRHTGKAMCVHRIRYQLAHTSPAEHRHQWRNGRASLSGREWSRRRPAPERPGGAVPLGDPPTLLARTMAAASHIAEQAPRSGRPAPLRCR